MGVEVLTWGFGGEGRWRGGDGGDDGGERGVGVDGGEVIVAASIVKERRVGRE